MMRKLLSSFAVIVLVAVATPGRATAPEPIWHHWMSFVVIEVAVAPNGDAVVVGYEPVGGPPPEILVVARVSPEGKTLWRTTWRSPDAWGAVGTRVAVTRAGDIVVLGNLVEPMLGEVAHAHMWSFSRSGELRWHREVQGPPRAFDVADLAVGASRIVVAAQTYKAMSPFPTTDGWIQAYTLRGSLVWTNHFEVGGVHGRDGIGGVAVGPDGRVYATGWVLRSSGGRLIRDMVIQGIGPNGVRAWSWVRPKDRWQDQGHDVAVRGDRVYVVGEVHALSRRDPVGVAWLARFTPGGRPQWHRTWGPSGTYSAAYHVAVHPGGAVYTTGCEACGAASANDLRRWSADGVQAWRYAFDGGRYPASAPAVDRRGVYLLVRLALWRFPA